MKALFLTRLSLLAIIQLLTSCVTPDPVFQRNYRDIADVDYPDSTIIGRWMIAGGHSEFMGNRNVRIEDRFYLLLKDDGAGVLQEFNKYEGRATPAMTERRLTWKAIGKNRWQFVTKPKTLRLLSEPEGITVSLNRNAPPRIVTLRYHDGRLYPSDVPNTWVRANDEDEDEVKRKLAEIRSLLH